MTATLPLPRLRADQWRVASHPAKIKVVCMGRRWGKTILGLCLALSCAAARGKVGWGAPAYKNTRPLWRAATNAVSPLKVIGLARVSSTDRTITFANGGFLAIYSLDNYDSVRGEDFDLFVVDEAPLCAEAAVTEAIMPTLADRDGDLVLIGTPKGYNWFAGLWQQGRDAEAKQPNNPDIVAFRAPSSDNPNQRIKAAAEKARRRLSGRAYEQEWEAQFIADGAVFRNIDGCVRDPPERRGRVVVGADWAKLDDESVFVAWDIDHRYIVDIEANSLVDFNIQIQRLVDFVRRNRALVVLGERNGVGEALCDMASAAGLPIERFWTDNQGKARMVGDLAGDLDHGRIGLPANPTLLEQLRAFAATKTAAGNISYAAPLGTHDDYVLSLMFAREAEMYVPVSMPRVRIKEAA